MTTFGKWLTLLVIGAIIVLLVTHPAGSAGNMAVGGQVLSNILNIESGANVSGGTTGSVNYGGTSVSFGGAKAA